MYRSLEGANFHTQAVTCFMRSNRLKKSRSQIVPVFHWNRDLEGKLCSRSQVNISLVVVLSKHREIHPIHIIPFIDIQFYKNLKIYPPKSLERPHEICAQETNLDSSILSASTQQAHLPVCALENLKFQCANTTTSTLEF